LLIAIVTLTLRKVIVVFLLVLAPMAIVFWILPGTDKWWKMWKDNFVKLMLMFPIIIGFVSAGRIFAYIASGMGNDNSINFFVILIAYFGPLFLIPKTFSMGGQLMTWGANGINKAGWKLKETRPIKRVEEARQHNIKARDTNSKLAGLEQATSGRNWLSRGVGRVRAGSAGAGVYGIGNIRRRDLDSGAYARQLRANERKADMDNKVSELSEMMRGTTNQNADIDNILNAEEGQQANVNGRMRTVTCRMQHAALLQAPTLRRHNAIDNYMTRLNMSGNQQALGEATDIVSSNFATFDDAVPDIARGDPIGASISPTSNSWQTAVNKYNSVGGDRRAAIQYSIRQLINSGNAAQQQQAIGHINSILSNANVEDAHKAQLLADLQNYGLAAAGIDYNDIAASGGNMRIGMNPAGQLDIVPTIAPPAGGAPGPGAPGGGPAPGAPTP